MGMRTELTDLNIGNGCDWNWKEIMEMGGNGNENIIPAHFYCRCGLLGILTNSFGSKKG